MWILSDALFGKSVCYEVKTYNECIYNNTLIPKNVGMYSGASACFVLMRLIFEDIYYKRTFQRTSLHTGGIYI